MSNESFIDRLRRVIAETPGLTPAGLAVKAGLDNSAIRSLLSGRAKNPRWDTIEKICAALGTTIEEFMSSAQTPEEQEIVRLVAQLSLAERRQLLGYAEGLRATRDRQPPESGAGEE